MLNCLMCVHSAAKKEPNLSPKYHISMHHARRKSDKRNVELELRFIIRGARHVRQLCAFPLEE